MAFTLEEKFTIGQKEVTVIYDFSLYSERDYGRDFREVYDYQAKRWEKPPDKDGFEWKFYNSKNPRQISFSEFADTTKTYLTKVLMQVLRDNQNVMMSDDNKFLIRIIVFRVPKRAWYIEERPQVELKKEEYAEFLEDIESETVEHHNYLVSGSFLLQSIAIPLFWAKGIDYTYLYRYFVHELEHHVQKMMGFYSFQDEVSERLKRRVMRVPNYRINLLFLTMQALLNEGVADFKAITNRHTIDIHMDWIRKFRKDLDALTTIIGKNKAQKFWEENLGFGVFAGGAYYCGKIMAFTIALAILKRSGGKLNDINRLMREYKEFNLPNADPAALQAAYDAILRTNYNYRNFIRLYEQCCIELGISHENMIIWWELFDALKKKATRFYENLARKKRMEMYEKIKRAIKQIY